MKNYTNKTLLAIGILGLFVSSFLIAEARSQTSDVAIKSNINNLRPQAELYFDENNSSYEGLCESTVVLQFAESIDLMGGRFVCVDSEIEYAFESILITEEKGFHCIDSTGFVDTNAASSDLSEDNMTCENNPLLPTTMTKEDRAIATVIILAVLIAFIAVQRGLKGFKSMSGHYSLSLLGYLGYGVLFNLLTSSNLLEFAFLVLTPAFLGFIFGTAEEKMRKKLETLFLVIIASMTVLVVYSVTSVELEYITLLLPFFVLYALLGVVLQKYVYPFLKKRRKDTIFSKMATSRLVITSISLVLLLVPAWYAFLFFADWIF